MTAISLVVIVLLFFLCSSGISPGNGGVVYSMNGGVEMTPLGQGRHPVSPIAHVMEYPISKSQVYLTASKENGRKGKDDSFFIGTKDGTKLKAEGSFTYRLEFTELPAIYTNFHGRDAEWIEWNYMAAEFAKIVNEITAGYGNMEIIGAKKGEINQQIFAAFKEKMANDHIIIESAGLTTVDPDPASAAAIQAVITAENNRKANEIDKQTVLIQAEKAKIYAQGQSEAARINADAQAYTNSKVQQSATQEVIALKWIEKWNGALPATVTGSSGSYMINLK